MTNQTDALLATGRALLDKGDAAGAAERFRSVLSVDKDNVAAMIALGRALLALGQLKNGIRAAHRATVLCPQDPQAKAVLLQGWTRLMAHEPGNAQVAVNLADAALSLGHTDTARDALQIALVIDPTAERARWLLSRLLPRVYMSRADIDRWRARFSASLCALEAIHHPSTPEAAEPVLQRLLERPNFELPYQAQNDRDLQKVWGRLCARVSAARLPDLAARPAPRPLEGRADRRLRVGYASSFFRKHTIGLLFLGWIRHADRERFKVFVYLTSGGRDDGSDVILRHAEEERDLCALSFEDAARALRADDLDILVYPDLGMEPRSFMLASLPLAPIQCVSWGHPVTTGLPTMDWFLTSDLMEAPDGETLYSERLHRLPRLSVAYTPPDPHDAKGRAALGLPEDGVLYLCCQAQQKYLPQYDSVFPAIARGVPAARFVFIEHKVLTAVNDAFRARLERAFRQAGVDPDPHLIFLPWQPWRDFLCLHRACDVFLDSIGWSGGNTTLEALSRALPPVTLPSRFMRGRHTYAMLRMMKMTELVARDLRSYVDIAVRLGRDPEWRRTIRDTITSRRHILYNDVGVVRALESFYESAHAEALANAALNGGVETSPVEPAEG